MKIDIDRVETVTPDTNIGDLVLFHPETADLLFSIGLHCLGCPSSGVETVSEAAAVHGIAADDLVKKLNRIIKNQSAYNLFL
jgi:hybrid cluster-associated redox disulfide protein